MEMTTKAEVTQLSYDIVGCAITVHKELGPGLLESVYEECLRYELIQNGFQVKQQMPVPIVYGGMTLKTELRLDLLVEETIVVELKAKEKVPPIEEAKLITYMKLLKKPQGLMINFFTENITKSMKPFVNEYFKSLPD